MEDLAYEKPVVWCLQLYVLSLFYTALDPPIIERKHNFN